MAKIEPANLLLKDKNGNTGLVKSLTNKDITTLKNVVTNVNYIKDFVNANGGSLPVQGDLKLTATDAAGKNGKILLGTSSGTLQWNGKNIVRSVNGTNADVNGNVSITSVANATNADNATNLGGYPASDYVRSVNGVNADASGNADVISGGYDYVRFADGTQIVFQRYDQTAHPTFVQFVKPFTKAPLCYPVIRHVGELAILSATLGNVSATGASFYAYFNGKPTHNDLTMGFIAFGRWK